MLELNPAALVRNNSKIVYNLDILIIKNLNLNVSDLKAQVSIDSDDTPTQRYTPPPRSASRIYNVSGRPQHASPSFVAPWEADPSVSRQEREGA